jgi:pimeloyl-ACP methyl ester carboxylesterase
MHVSAGEISLSYEEGGQGTPLVLVHGLGSCLRFWDGVREPLEKHHRVVRYDVRGFGESDQPAGPYDTTTFASDLAALLDALGIDRAHVVGLSMGGVIAQRFALDFPARLRSLVLLSTSAEVGEKAAAFWNRLADLVERYGLSQRVLDASRSFSAAFAAANPDIVRLHSEPGRNVAGAYAATARAMSSFGWSAELKRVEAPVLVLQGLADQLTPPGGAVRLSRAFPRARLLLVPEVGHFIPIEQPVLFTSTVLAFTAGVDFAMTSA